MTYWQAVKYNTKWLAKMLAILAAIMLVAAVLAGIGALLWIYTHPIAAVVMFILLAILVFAWVDWKVTNKLMRR